MRAFLLAGVLLLAGCSTTSLDQARSLAAAGKATSDSTADYLEVPRQSFAQYMDQLALASSFPLRTAQNPTGCNIDLAPPTDALRTAAGQYFAELRQTRRFFVELGKTYDAFGDLASYNASGAVETSIANLSAAVNEHAGDDDSARVPENISGLIGAGGGLIAGEAQKRAVVASSREIRLRLEAFTKAMRGRRGLFVNVRSEQVRTGYSAARVLFCAGYMDARPILRGAASGYGMDPIVPGSPITGKDGTLSAGVDAVLAGRSIAAQADVLTAFDQVVDALDSLVAQHRKLEAGQPVDIKTLAARAATLRRLVDTYAGDE